MCIHQNAVAMFPRVKRENTAESLILNERNYIFIQNDE